MSKKSKSEKALFKPNDIVLDVTAALTRDLYMGGFDPFYSSIGSNPKDAVQHYLQSQYHDYLKKYYDPSDRDEKLADAAYKKFFEVSSHLRDVNSRPSLQRAFELASSDRHVSRRELIPFILRRARNIISYVLGPFDLEEMYRECKNSNGTTIGVSFVNTSVEAKFAFPLTGNENCIKWFEEYLLWDTNLSLALDDHNKWSDKQKYAITNHSRATTVPKNSKIDRMIAVEPTLNMFFQQGIEGMMCERLKILGVDIKVQQEAHKWDAQKASITRSKGTIDWSSASDCVLIDLVKCLLPRNWYLALMCVRSPQMLHTDGRFLDLPMISTMGNATTFPLETLIFASIAHACRSFETDLSNSTIPEVESLTDREITVFGDDCILPTQFCRLFTYICEKVGFIINSEKSFFGEQYFRESCGGDYLDFRNVRPLHLKAPTGVRISDLESWLYVIYNSFKQKNMSFFGELRYAYCHVFEAVAKLFERYNILPCVVPNEFPDDSGLKILDDYDRLSRPFKSLRKPKILKTGLVSFTYKYWKYPDQTWTFSHLRYWMQLKNPSSDTLRQARTPNGYLRWNLKQYAVKVAADLQEVSIGSPFQDIKKMGGYCCGRGYAFMAYHESFKNYAKHQKLANLV